MAAASQYRLIPIVNVMHNSFVWRWQLRTVGLTTEVFFAVG